MKKNVFLSLIALFVSLILSTYAFSLTLYDDFSGTYINEDKWIQTEWVTEISGGKLILKQASPNPIGIMSYPYIMWNRMDFNDPSSVNSIQADVSIVENIVTGLANTGVRIEGRFYNDGTSGVGCAGDVWAAIEIHWTGTEFKGIWFLDRFNEEGTEIDLDGGYFTTAISIGTTYTLYIGYNSGINEFLFKIGGEQVTFGPTGLPTHKGDAACPRKILLTRVETDNENSSAYISATFDNVYKNGTLYDDFSSSIIDETKWTTYEFVREISGGKLRSKIRSSSASSSTIDSNLEFLNPSSINAIQVKVTPLTYQMSQPLFERAAISGNFYNDGTPGGYNTGDVGAQVRIVGGEHNPFAEWDVWKATDFEIETLASGTFTTPISLGNTYTLFLGWDGNRFTVRIDDEEAHYTPPVKTINLPKFPPKIVGTRIKNPTGKEATIEVLFDDVRVNEATPPPPNQYTLTILKSGTGSGTVASSPGGINCGNDCSEVYTQGTKITLTAKADTNSTFTGWSGGGCTGTKTCTVTVDSEITVTASFALKTPDISVSPGSLDFGSVKSGKKTTKTLKITNNGSGDLLITLSGLEETDFSIQGSSSVTIKGKKSYSLKVLFTPTSADLKTATLEITSNDPDTPTIDISLSGTGQ
jgi:hypothetical protein